jgi:TPR repeat protein
MGMLATVGGVICFGGCSKTPNEASSAPAPVAQAAPKEPQPRPVDPAAEARRREARALYDQATEAEDKKDIPRALDLYEKACAQGVPNACGTAGIWYLDARKGVKKNYAKALALETNACDGDLAEACNNLGVMYASGKGVEPDIAKAAVLYDKSCKLGSKLGCGHLKDVRWKLATDASDLWKGYSANEVAADNKWKKQRLQVAGLLQSIRKDFKDGIVLDLRSPNRFMPTRAHLNDSESETAASLKQGQRVLLSCTCQGRIMGSPVLKACGIEDVANPGRGDE